MADVEPGRPEGYLEAATVFWDYYLFDDALRMLDEGRNRLGNPALYAYEAGAIHENRRDYSGAISEYLKGALSPDGGSAARRRLVELARRPAQRELVDQVTAQLVAGQNPGSEAVSLRVSVLEAQQRGDDLAALLSQLVENTTSFELLEQISNIASSRRLDAVRVQSLERQIALTQDPVDRMRLRLSLMQLHEGRNETAAARQVIDALYEENPKILGVVRAAVDFSWRQKDHDRALDLLDEAAAQAYPELRSKLMFEAARKATDVAQYDRARRSLQTLLAADPFDAQYLAAMADTYGRENDYAALRSFYEAKIAALNQADLPAARKREQLAALRRGLIPALTKLGDPAAAVDQYIEIINRFPDDEGLVGEASRYAESHGLRQRLIDSYVKTAAASPKDYRYQRVLAWVYRDLEQLPEAIEAFQRASAVRPEMAGLLESRAALEERLMRFDAALATYQQLYELRYHDPRWMEKIAEMYARQQRRAEAVEAIEKALISGRPERAENFAAAAERLESWNYLEDALRFAQRAVELAGDRLLQDYSYDSALRLYARLATRLRQYEPAYRRLLAAWPQQPNDFTQERLGVALGEMASTVASYFTPEEKTSFVAFLEKEKAALPPLEFERRLLPLARQAGLNDLAAKWLAERMMADPGSDAANTLRQQLVELQQQRLRHEELAGQLEAYWQVYPPGPDRDNVLLQAAEAYRTAGNSDAELRVLDLALHGGYSDRFLELLLRKQPDRLVALATPTGPQQEPDRPANMALAGDDAALAERAVQARGRNLPPVWTSAYTGLVGLYFGRPSAATGQAFQAALGTANIGKRLAAPVDRDQQLAGDLWFYYGARYGEYLGLSDVEVAEGYLPATVEAAPGRSSAYAQLGDTYRDLGDLARAVVEYQHALELDENQGRLNDRLAEILWTRGEHDAAAARWRSALEAFASQVAKGSTPPSFWEDVSEALRHIGGHSLEPPLRDAIRTFFEQYTRRNGAYRIESLLGAWFDATADKAAVLQAALELGEGAPNPEEFLGNVAKAPWLPQADREAFFDRVVAILERRLAEAMGPRNAYAERNLDEWRIRRIEYWLESSQPAKAQAAIDAAGESLKQMLQSERAALWVEVAARAGRLDSLLASYGQDAAVAPPLEALRDAATALRRAGQSAPAERLLEFYYTRQLEQRDLSASNFLGLAELRFEQKEPEEALALLRRMTLVSGEPFENLTAAADLLSKFGRDAEAAAFLAERLRAAPWDFEALRKHSQAQLAAGDAQAAATGLTEVASSPLIPYEQRAAAARALGSRAAASQASPAGTHVGAGAPENLGSAELALLAANAAPAPGPAAQPFYYEARLTAAPFAPLSDRVRLLREAVALNPDDAATRLVLFRAAHGAAEFQLAVAAFEPLAANTNLAYRFQQYDSPLDEHQPDIGVDRWMAQQFLSAQGLDDAARAALASDLAHALEQVERLGLAELVYRLALELSPPGLQHSAIEQSVDRVHAVRQRRAQNASRRPVITKNLDQDHLVRPRLAAAPQTGGAQ